MSRLAIFFPVPFESAPAAGIVPIYPRIARRGILSGAYVGEERARGKANPRRSFRSSSS